MAKVRFKNRTNGVIKAKYVEKKTFKRGLFAFCCVSLLLTAATHRLYVLGEFKGVLTTYYTLLTQFIEKLL